MRFSKLVLLGLAALSAGACEDDDGITDPVPRGPEARVRFVNAVPDTGAVDLRFVDRVENLPTFLGVAFRATSGVYQPVAAGTRPVRVFPNSSSQTMAMQRLIDTTITLEANKRYTLVYGGRAIGGQDRLAVIEDPFEHPTPPAGSIAIRALHVAVGTGAVDVYFAPSDSLNPNPDPTVSPTATVRNVGYLSQSAYVNLPVRPAGDSLALYTKGVTPAGSTTLLFRTTSRQRGVAAPAGATHGPQPGVQIAGSVMTAIIFSGATPGTRGATSANTSPTILLLPDKALNP